MKENNISEWRNAIISLPQDHFFDLICSYLGEIKTPFNKQKLLEQLSAFLRKPKIKQIIAESIDLQDTLILTAVKIISEPTQNIIADFFSEEFSLLEIYNRLINLEERLLIYKTKHKDNDKEKIYKINPLLIEEISERLEPSIFRLPEKNGKTPEKVLFNEIFFAGLYSFIFHNTDILKKDETLKKKIGISVAKIFPYLEEEKKRINLILNALQNLGLIIKTDSGVELQNKKWKSFAELSLAEKAAYICTAAAGKFNKDNLQKAAQIFMEIIFLFEDGAWYNKSSLMKNYFLLYKNNFKFIPAEDLSAFWKENEDCFYEGVSINILKAAEILGIFCKNGNLFAVNPELKKNAEYSKKPLLISPSFEITLTPSSSFADIIDILPCMEPVSVQTIGVFSINKKTCGTFFGTEASAEKICTELQKLTEHEIPQNVFVSINQWYKNYTSISIYEGIIVCAANEKEKFFLQDTPISKLVQKKLADGIYLMKPADMKDIETAAAHTGLEFIFYGNAEAGVRNLSAFSNLEICRNSKTDFNKTDQQKEEKQRSEKYLQHIKKLQSKVKAGSLKEEEQKILNERILRKVIIDEQQIKTSTIRIEEKEASGVNFLGKVRIAEAAVNSKHFLEIYFHDSGTVKKILGLPVSIEKNNADAKLTLLTEPEKKEISISVAQALKIKAVRNSIFS